MKFISKNKYIILTIILLSCLMFYFIGEKQGFHEDEIFSIGSSNYKYDNVYRPFGYADANQDVFYKQVLKGNKLHNLLIFILDNDSFTKDEVLSKEVPIFKSNNEALEYLTIGKSDIFNYFSVYYNQSIDVHPPLFYFLVHFVSTLFYGTFSKYIIFSINLLFFIGTLWIINKIMNQLKQEKLSIPTMILYGASIGGISTVMFQRMYMMLTSFSILYLYLTIKFVQDDFKIKRKLPWIVTILCGFLTQYYFCIYIVLVFILLSVYLIIKKQYKKLLDYFIVHVIAAVIGVVFYPASIYHIFFSYRGFGDGGKSAKPILESIAYYLKQIYKLFGFKNLLLVIVIISTILIIKNKISISKEKINYLILLIVPIIVYILLVSKIAPFLGESYTSRYIMLVLPIIAISIMYLFSFVIKFNITPLIISIVLVINGLYNETPVYLYKDYKKVMDLANIYKNDYFVYVFDNNFTHLSSLPEFATYKASLIINVNDYDFSLLNNDELNSSNEFIVCIKNWLNQEEFVNKILENTKYNKYEKLLELNSDVEATYFKFS